MQSARASDLDPANGVVSLGLHGGGKQAGGALQQPLILGLCRGSSSWVDALEVAPVALLILLPLHCCGQPAVQQHILWAGNAGSNAARHT